MRDLRGALSAAVVVTVLASSSLGGIGGCSLRDRSNPLDPRNQTTHGSLSGFNAIAGDNIVTLSWTPIQQLGVESYRLDRWLPGQAPRPLPGALYPSYVATAEDFTAHNDSTYLYRVVAHFTSGDSAASPPDTATPGTRRIMVLVATLPGVAGLSPDARDILYGDLASEPYDELDLDSTRGVFWLSQFDRGVISSRRFESLAGQTEFQAFHPTDIAITTQRSVVWAAQPELSRVARFLVGDTTGAITGVGPARTVESNSANATLWIGSDDGRLFHASAPTLDTLQSWQFTGRVGPIAVDEASDEAWVAVRATDLFDLYLVRAGNPDPILLRSGLLNVTDIEVEAVTRTAWLCERGAPLAGNGRLTRFGRDGAVLATVGGFEPYTLSVEPRSREVWVTDIRSDRLIEVSPTGAILRRSPALGVPYGVRVYRP
jgi:DNA-binding beta-propeller fold protein YncE